MSSGVRAKKKTKKKKTHTNWFEKLSVDELKSLCRASGLPVSGTKAALSERLCNSEVTRDYAYEYAPQKMNMSYINRINYSDDDEGGSSLFAPQLGAKRADGTSMDELKAKCRDSGLVVSGKRYDLVLRLLQHETGLGGTPKRAAGTMDEVTGTFQPKKKAKSMKLPDVDKIHDRVYKKFFPSDEVTMKWSNNKHKYYPGECVKFATNLLDKEVFEKELFQRGEETLAWEVINTILYRLTVGDIEARDAYKATQVPGRMYFALGGTQIEFGRCEWEVKGDLLPKLVQAMRMTSSSEGEGLGEGSGDLLWKFYDRLMQYGYGDNVECTVDGKTESFKVLLNEHVPRKMNDVAEN